jgi:hypothetical protein
MEIQNLKGDQEMKDKETPKRAVISLICLTFVGCTAHQTQDEPSSTTVALKQEPSSTPSFQVRPADIESDPLYYEVIAAEDQSRKALVKRLSDYTYQELASLPIDKKVLYRVVVSPQIKENQVRPVVEKIIADITAEDSDIDELTVFLFSDRELANGPYDVGAATWAPHGALGNVTPEIARNNNRDSYRTSIQVKENLEEYLQKRSRAEERLGLTEGKRRQIFKEIVAAEDKAQAEADRRYPVSGSITWNMTKSQLLSQMDRNTQLMRALEEKYKNDLTRKYGLTREQLKEITHEGIAENWPMPAME